MFFPDHVDLFAPRDMVAVLEPWRPVPLDHSSWPPPYAKVYAWRIEQLEKLRGSPELLASAKAYYSTRPGAFICDWCDTFNPRKEGTRWMPFVLFSKQAEFIEFLQELDRDQASGLIEKCRDIGATWLACAYSVWSFIFNENDAIGWGSRKQELVDKLGDPDSIFEKMRLLMKRLPDIFLPPRFNARNHATFMKLLNPANGSSITGESGDNIGRGGRKTRYFKDEAAHLERPELIEAALGDNTNVQIDMSSVNGTNNVFYRRRKAGVLWAPGVTIEPGKVRVFIFDWRDHPEKTQAWYDQRKAKYDREGMPHLFAQEVDRNYSAAVQNTIIPYEWIVACIDAHLKIPYLRIPPPNLWSAGLDVADGGLDLNALSVRQWIILRHVEETSARDPGVTTREVIAAIRPHKGIKVQYDNIGLGSAVKSEYNRLIEDGTLKRNDVEFIGWNAGAAVVDPFDRVIPDDDESPLNKDFYKNMKAQAWWAMRTRIYKTWRVVMSLAPGQTLEIYNADELCSWDSSSIAPAALMQMMQELAQPVRAQSVSLQMIVQKQPDGTKSPNMGDSVVMNYSPAPESGDVLIGGFG